MTQRFWHLLRGERSNKLDPTVADERISALLQSTNFGCLTDANGLILHLTPRMAPLLGFPCNDLPGYSFFERINPRDRARADDLWAEASAGAGRVFMADLRFRRSDGNWRWLGVDVMNLLDDPSVGGIVLGLRDIDARKLFENQVAFREHHDELTSLPNRTLFLERMNQAMSWSRRHGSVIGALFLDIDGFADINEEYGWHVGDTLLARFAERLETCIRRGDTAAHLSEDEFVVLLEDLEHPDDTIAVARRVLHACQDPFVVNGLQMRIGVSIGIATTNDGAHDSRSLVGQAGAAMCSAKDVGRGRYELYRPESQNEASTPEVLAPSTADVQ